MLFTTKDLVYFYNPEKGMVERVGLSSVEGGGSRGVALAPGRTTCPLGVLHGHSLDLEDPALFTGDDMDAILSGYSRALHGRYKDVEHALTFISGYRAEGSKPQWIAKPSEYKLCALNHLLNLERSLSEVRRRNLFEERGWFRSLKEWGVRCLGRAQWRIRARSKGVQD